MDTRRVGRIVAVAANTFRETIRERVLYNLVFFAMLMSVSGLLLGEISLRQDEKILKDIGLAAMDFFGTLIAIFIGVGLVSKEIDRRSLYPLLAKPLGRGELIIGKFAGLGFTLAVNLALMAAGLVGTLLLNGRAPDAHLLLAVYPIYLSLLLTVALALFFSSVTSSALAVVLTIGLVMAGRLSDIILNMRDVTPNVPAWLIQAVYSILPNFRNFDFKNRVVYGDPVPFTDLAWVTAYAIVYTVIVLGVTTTVFRSRDFQ